MQVNAFAAQLKSMTDAYLAFSLATADADEGLAFTCETPENAEIQETQTVLIVDMFCEPFLLNHFYECRLTFISSCYSS